MAKSKKKGNENIKGSCHCQAVKYQVESSEPYPYQKCYCSICRKTSGAGGYAINLSANMNTLQVEGEEYLAMYRAVLSGGSKRKESKVERRFCKLCGSHLWAWHPAWPDLLHPVAGSVDSELPQPPCYTHLMLGSKAHWVDTFATDEDLCFDEYPEESIAEWHLRVVARSKEK